MRRLSTQEADFAAQLDDLLAWESVSDLEVQASVTQIVTDVRQRGDEALVTYTNRFDRMAADFEAAAASASITGVDADVKERQLAASDALVEGMQQQ